MKQFKIITLAALICLPACIVRGQQVNNTEGIPEALLKSKLDMSASLPKPVLKIGETSVTARLVGYQADMGDGKARLFCFRFFPSTDEEMEAPIDNNGVATFRFRQYGTHTSVLNAAGQEIKFMTDPGDKAVLYIDLRATNKQTDTLNHNSDTVSPVFYTSGKYAAVNKALNNDLDDYSLDLRKLFSKDINIDTKSPEEYIAIMLEKYNSFANRLDTGNLTPIEKALVTINNKFFLHYSIFMGNMFQERTNRLNNKPADSVIKYTEKNFDILKDYKINGLEYLYSSYFAYLHSGYFQDSVNLEHITGAKEGFLFDLKKAYKTGSKLADMEPLNDEDKAAVKTIKNPFFKRTVDIIAASNKKSIEEATAKGEYRVCETPQTSNESLFDSIMSKYKGKTALVDFWATWCGPCRSAIQKTEPLKDSVLKSDDLVFVYITGPSSPQNLWLQMLCSIKGEHYRLNAEQWQFVCKKFEITGIPSYVLLRKSGDYMLRNDFRNHNVLKQTLLEELSAASVAVPAAKQ